MLHVMKWIAAVIGIGIAGCVTVFLVHNLTPPKFKVKQISAGGNGFRIEIRPNFVVNSIRNIDVKQSGRTLVSRRGVFDGSQLLDVPGEFQSGDKLSITCDLQYDHWISACGTTVEKQLVVK